jgi:hypothetical protein
MWIASIPHPGASRDPLFRTQDAAELGPQPPLSRETSETCPPVGPGYRRDGAKSAVVASLRRVLCLADPWVPAFAGMVED